MEKLRSIAIGMVAFFITVCTACGNEGSEPNLPSICPPGPDTIEAPAIVVEPLTSEIRPMYVDGRRWIVGDTLGSILFRDEVVGDTLLDGDSAKIIKRVYGMGSSINYNYKKEANGSTCHWRIWVPKAHEDGYKDEWMPYYNMNFKPGDQLITDLDTITTVSSGTVAVMGKLRRAVKIHIHPSWFWSNHPDSDYWIEGIGSIAHFEPQYYNGHPLSSFRPKMDRILLECWDGDEKIYDYREFQPELYQPLEE